MPDFVIYAAPKLPKDSLEIYDMANQLSPDLVATVKFDRKHADKREAFVAAIKGKKVRVMP